MTLAGPRALSTPSMLLSRTAVHCLPGSRKSWWRRLPWLLSVRGKDPRIGPLGVGVGGGINGLWACRSQKSPESPAPQLSMLRIKSENGEQAFLLMMRPEDTIGDVRVLLAQARWVWGAAGSPRER